MKQSQIARRLTIAKAIICLNYRNIVAGNGSLRGNVQGTFADINDVGDLIHDRNGPKVSGCVNGVEFAEAFDDVLVPLRYNVEDCVGFGNGPVPQRIGARSASRGAAAEAVENVTRKQSLLLLLLLLRSLSYKSSCTTDGESGSEHCWGCELFLARLFLRRLVFMREKE